jgi:phi LC3 family holin
MNINWKVRIKNKTFWLSLIPTVLVLIQLVMKTFGVELDFGEVGNNLIAIVNTVFVLLGILGVVVDPTTAGVADSSQAMTYEKPKDY